MHYTTISSFFIHLFIPDADWLLVFKMFPQHTASCCNIYLNVLTFASQATVRKSETSKSIKFYCSNAIENGCISGFRLNRLCQYTAICCSRLCRKSAVHISDLLGYLQCSHIHPPSDCNSTLHYRFSRLLIWSHNESLGSLYLDGLSLLSRKNNFSLRSRMFFNDEVRYADRLYDELGSPLPTWSTYKHSHMQKSLIISTAQFFSSSKSELPKMCSSLYYTTIKQFKRTDSDKEKCCVGFEN